MKQIYVATRAKKGDTPTPVGVIRFDAEKGFGYFAYLSNYEGPPLDPVNLDYRKPFNPAVERHRKAERVFMVDTTVSPGLMHQVFVDAMPGQWGMQVLAAEYPEIRQMKDAEKLHWMGRRTCGAISFFVDQMTEERTVKGLSELEAVRRKCEEFLTKLQKMGLDEVRNPAVATHGGVMPKAAYEDGSGKHWIAKFDRPGEGTQYTLLESLANQMAAKCGIQVPVTKAISDNSGAWIYLAERYDREGESRHHKISFMSLLAAKDAGQGDYRDLFKVLKQVCDPAAWPAQRDELLRRMAFNIGLNITDDHLRNHELKLSADGKWELSPAFDLVPVSGPSPHQCAIFGKPRASLNLDNPDSRSLWSRVAQELGVEESHVFGIVDKVGATIRKEWAALVEHSPMNRFNQMQALMAAEVGCATPFPSARPSQQPMGPQEVAELERVIKIIRMAAKAMTAGTPEGVLALSKAMEALHADAPRLSQSLRRAGKQDAADAILMAPLSQSAKALLDPASKDGMMPAELVEASDRIQSALPQTARSASPQKTPSKTSPPKP